MATITSANGSPVASPSPTAQRAQLVTDDTGTLIEIPGGAVLDEPITIAYDLDAAGIVPHTSVVAGNGARATIVERVTGRSGKAKITTEITAGAGAHITYVVVQDAGGTAQADAARRSHAATGARVDWCLALLGASDSTDELTVSLAERGASGDVSTLFFPTGRQTVALTVDMLHDAPMTASQTVARAIAADNGRGRFFGNIKIAAHAHGSDASLRDDTLLFGTHARVDAIPALEIAANDVKAFHGATVGAIDEEHVFYVMSRGIDRTSAERLIALGFFEPAIARFPSEALREELRAMLAAKLTGARV
jgi:Fe-S cluster assembly protein SufD